MELKSITYQKAFHKISPSKRMLPGWFPLRSKPSANASVIIHMSSEGYEYLNVRSK